MDGDRLLIYLYPSFSRLLTPTRGGWAAVVVVWPPHIDRSGMTVHHPRHCRSLWTRSPVPVGGTGTGNGLVPHEGWQQPQRDVSARGDHGPRRSRPAGPPPSDWKFQMAEISKIPI